MTRSVITQNMNAFIVYTAFFLICFAVDGCSDEPVKHPASVKMAAGFEKGVEALIEAGASEISHQVGIKTSYAKSRWVILPGMTCICLVSLDGNSIALIQAGEGGKGYGGKDSWHIQEKTRLSEIRILRQGEFQLVREMGAGESPGAK
ncbi:MAG: hypothetical protein NTY98_01845 [Verrucomicrobia bacterium]|nr:hypothetical protein [Verrucomicrobiota bacterium]